MPSAHFQNQHDAPQTVTLSKEQFDKLVELLTPSYEMAKLYLAENPEMGSRHEPDDTDQPAPPADE